jgi:DNA topoisomerase-1
MKEKLVGEKLVKAMEEKEKREGSVGTCPNCGSPLKIIRSRKTKKIFIGCSNYPRCSTSFPLPQKTGIRTTDKKCKYCGLPMVSIPMGKRRLLSCIDMKCESKTKFKKN